MTTSEEGVAGVIKGSEWDNVYKQNVHTTQMYKKTNRGSIVNIGYNIYNGLRGEKNNKRIEWQMVLKEAATTVPRNRCKQEAREEREENKTINVTNWKKRMYIVHV